ncbi:E3 ubiquitin-protein ligase sh3rf3 [Branchiostoma belcheri]|nr:E3 ubiquitin-protein ligase sh3rf3 [Branchiostoma belcheri]
MMDEKVLEDLLECSVCLGRLTTNSKVLPCQHTFCKRCLEQIVRSKNELRCPECRILVTCSVDELPSNILLVRLLDGIKERRRTATASQERSPKSSHGGQGGKGATGDAGAAAQAQKTPATSRGSPVKTERAGETMDSHSLLSTSVLIQNACSLSAHISEVGHLSQAIT